MSTSPTIPSFRSWMQASDGAAQPWLIIGKGPSYARFEALDTDGYRALSLNHVVRERRVDVAHIVDYDVVTACGESLLENCGVLVMPWHPHAHDPDFVEVSAAHSKDLAWFADQDPVLGKLREQGRLLTYNLVTGNRFAQYPGERMTPLFFFGFEGAFNLLAEAGVKKIRSIGVDGGTNYSNDFGDLNQKTLLVNGVDSFDRQFHPIAQTRFEQGIDFCPLDDEAPVRVFVAASDSEMLAVKVLEYSILRNCSRNVQVQPIMAGGVAIPRSPKAEALAATPFSFQRFLIPELCGFRGKAIYLDSDMLVFKDLREVWTAPMRGQQILTVQHEDLAHRKPQFSVMLLDCESLDWRIGDILESLETGRLGYPELMTDMVVAERIEQALPAHWNRLEHYVPRRTGLLHYTDQYRQPWISIKNPLAWVWVRELFTAVDAGFITRAYVEQQVRDGHVRPSLIWQLDHREENPLLIPRRRLKLDRDFVPPFTTVGAHTGLSHFYRRSRRDELNSLKARVERVKGRLKRRVNDLLGRPPPSPFH